MKRLKAQSCALAVCPAPCLADEVPRGRLPRALLLDRSRGTADLAADARRAWQQSPTHAATSLEEIVQSAKPRTHTRGYARSLVPDP